jgi:hypothetical protein
VSELAPAKIRTSIGNVSAIFALDGWLMLEAEGRTNQFQCRRSKDLAAGLVAVGLPADEADEVARALWRQRPGDASMPTDSASAALGVGNQWVVAAVILLLIAMFVIVFGYLLPHDLRLR